jgi:hypothetical protein
MIRASLSAVVSIEHGEPKYANQVKDGQGQAGVAGGRDGGAGGEG